MIGSPHANPANSLRTVEWSTLRAKITTSMDCDLWVAAVDALAREINSHAGAVWWIANRRNLRALLARSFKAVRS